MENNLNIRIIKEIISDPHMQNDTVTKQSKADFYLLLIYTYL